MGAVLSGEGSGGVVEDAAAGLAAEVAGGDETAQDGGGRDGGGAEVGEHALGDVEHDVEADEVAGGQRAHGVTDAEFATLVDVLRGSDARLPEAHGVHGEGHEEAVDDEGGRVLDADGG